MKIPTRFQLLGVNYTVKYNSKLNELGDGLTGLAVYRKAEIILLPRDANNQRTDALIEQTFFHELMHHILYLTGEDQFDPPIHKREFLVERIAGLLHQALSTAQYDTPDDD